MNKNKMYTSTAKRGYSLCLAAVEGVGVELCGRPRGANKL